MNNRIQNRDPNGEPSDIPLGLLNSTRGTLLLIGFVLLLGYGFALRHSLDLAIDGKTFYLSGKAMIVGGDPYDPAVEKALSERFAPDGENAHLFAHLLTHPPITPVLFAPLSLLPWSIFRLVLLAINVGSIPLIAYLCLRFGRKPSTKALWLTSFFIALLPPVWQAVKLGQIALPMLACALLAARFIYYSKWKSAVLLSLLAMVKPTFCVPLLAYLFVAGKPRARLALLCTAAVYGVINLIGVARLQMQGISFRESYRRALELSFSGGGINDPRLMGEIRLDAEVLLSQISFLSPQIAKYLLAMLIVGVFALAIRSCFRRENQQQFGWATAAMLLLAAVLFYHRSYDAVLLLPALFLAIADWWEYRRVPGASLLRWLYPALVVLILLCFSAIGSSDSNALNKILSPLGMVQPFWFKAACVLICTVIATAILKLHAKGKTA